jgi:cell division protein FtsW (lipid II flippase)
MKIKIDSSGLKESKWYEYLIRLLFGGAVTALAGIIAKRYGPEIGGLFLAFPAILTASATLIEKHEKEKKEHAGKNGQVRGKLAAGVDSIGASMGAIGLAVFALIVWLKLPDSGTATVLAIATLAWFVTAVLIWKLRQIIGRRIRKAGFFVSSVSSGAPLRRNRS